jgi:hypothetical protein
MSLVRVEDAGEGGLERGARTAWLASRRTRRARVHVVWGHGETEETTDETHRISRTTIGTGKTTV